MLLHMPSCLDTIIPSYIGTIISQSGIRAWVGWLAGTILLIKLLTEKAYKAFNLKQCPLKERDLQREP